MNSKTIKTRIKTFFTYDFLKVIAICVALCLIFTFIFHVVEKKPTEGQRFAVLYANDVIVGEESQEFYQNLLDSENPNAFSYDVLLVEPKQIRVIDESAYSMMVTYSDMFDDDVFICTQSLLESYVSTIRAEDLDKYVEKAFNYLYDNNFYSESGVINEAVIINSFTSKYKNDSRFKNSNDFERGKQEEIKRIKTIFENATILKEVFKNNPQIFDDKYNKIESLNTTGRYAIDLGTLQGGEKYVSNLFNRRVENEETGEVEYTSNGVYLLIGNNQKENGDLHFEGLAYIVNLLKTYSNLI